MDGKTRAPVGGRIIGLDQRHLALLHAREVIPFMVGVEARHLNLADPVLGLARHPDKITIRQCGAAAKGQRVSLDPASDGPSDINDREAAGQEVISLVRQDFAKPLFRRPGRVVIMDHR